VIVTLCDILVCSVICHHSQSQLAMGWKHWHRHILSSQVSTFYWH